MPASGIRNGYRIHVWAFSGLPLNGVSRSSVMSAIMWLLPSSACAGVLSTACVQFTDTSHGCGTDYITCGRRLIWR
jgi:hypothetical protein